MSKKLGRDWVAILCSIVLLGAGAVIVTPAANALSGIHWGQVWKHQIKPRADKRYYTKAKARKQFAPYPKTFRGTWSVVGDTHVAGAYIGSSISFGATFRNAPATHFILLGATPPTGCSGTAAAPKATPGNVCIFEAQNLNGSFAGTYNGPGQSGASPFGTSLYFTSAAVGYVFEYGSWAATPSGGISTGKVAHARTGSAHIAP